MPQLSWQNKCAWKHVIMCPNNFFITFPRIWVEVICLHLLLFIYNKLRVELNNYLLIKNVKLNWYVLFVWASNIRGNPFDEQCILSSEARFSPHSIQLFIPIRSLVVFNTNPFGHLLHLLSWKMVTSFLISVNAISLQIISSFSKCIGRKPCCRNRKMENEK